MPSDEPARPSWRAKIELPNAQTGGAASKHDKDEASKLEAEKERYNMAYEFLYPMLNEGRLDFALIAEATGQRERRLRESLQFRLTSGEVLQLFGQEKGYCYICDERLSDRRSKEPNCLPCLERIVGAVHAIARDQHADEAPAIETANGAPASENLQPQASKPIEGRQAAATAHVKTVGAPSASPLASEKPETDDGNDAISPARYEALVSELQNYRERYGPLSDSPVNGEPFVGVSTETTGQSPAFVSAADDAAADEVLAILTLDEQALEGELANLVDEADSLREPLRHFGFHRLKARK